MADPTTYSPGYNFSNFQSSSPATPLPAPQVDSELANIATAVASLDSAVKNVRRADGVLQNGLVTFESLSANLQAAGLAPASAWTAATGYLLGNSVVINSALYRCLVPHTSGVFATDLAAGKWVFVTALVAGSGYLATSTTSLPITVGAKTFAVQPGLAYQPGQRVRLISASSVANYMEGQLTAYAGGSMTVAVDFVGPTATGSHADWAVAVAGEKGAGDMLSSLNLADVVDKSAARDNLSVVHSIVAGSGISVGGTARDPVLSTVPAARVTGQNLLYNSDFVLTTKIVGDAGAAATATKSNGTAIADTIFCSSFTTSSNTPTFLCADTKELVNGSLITFGPSHGGLSGWALRVYNLVPNVSFQLHLPFGKLSPSNSPLNCYPVGISNSAANTYAPDHWVKSTSLAIWVDDFVANMCPGALRVVGMRKATTGAEYFNCTSAGNYSVQSWTERLRGRTVTLGAMVRCKVGGAGSRLIINDFPAAGGNVATYSTAVVGSGFADAANNNYEFHTVTATLSKDSLHVDCGLEANGAVGDIVYLGSPTLKFGSYMTRDDLGAPIREHVMAETHWNPPSLATLFGAVTPAVELITGSGLYGWTDLDIEALSYGQCHHAVSKVNLKIEFNTANAGCIIFVAALDPNPQLTFGCQATQEVANLLVSTGMSWLPLKKGQSAAGSPPGCFAIFSNNASQTIAALTFDLDDVLC